MPTIKKCPVTLKPYPPSDGCKGHIIPDALGGKMRTAACKTIDNKVGELFDTELIYWVENAESGKIKGKMWMTNILSGSLDILVGVKDGQFHITSQVPTIAANHLKKGLGPSTNAKGTITVILPNYRKALLSVVHSAILFAARTPTKRSGNLKLFRTVLKQGIADFDSITPQQWQQIEDRVGIVSKRTDGFEVSRNGPNVRKSTKFERVAFNYRNVCWGMVFLDGTIKKHPHNKLSRVFIFDK